MKLYQLTIIFVVIFGSMALLNMWKAEMKENDREACLQLEQACNSGLSAAADTMATQMNNACLPAEMNLKVVSSFYEGMATSFGFPYTEERRQLLEKFVPLLCMANEYEYEIFTVKLDSKNQLKLTSAGITQYGRDKGGDYGISGYGREKCIECIERELKNAIEKYMRTRGIDKETDVDIPEYAFSDYIETVNHPTVFAVSIRKNTGDADYTISLHGASIMPRIRYVSIEHNGKKEMHKENCERFLSLPDYYRAGIKTYNTPEEAALDDNFPAACCDPIGAYLADFLAAAVHAAP